MEGEAGPLAPRTGLPGRRDPEGGDFVVLVRDRLGGEGESLWATGTEVLDENVRRLDSYREFRDGEETIEFEVGFPGRRRVRRPRGLPMGQSISVWLPWVVAWATR